MRKDDITCADLVAYFDNCKPKPAPGCCDRKEPFCPPGFHWEPVPNCYPMPPKHECDCKPQPEPEPEIEVKKNSTEAQICKLSKKAAALNRLLANMTEKKKDVIIKIGDTSFNFSNVDAEFSGWDDNSEKSYAATVKRIIEHQRALIMAEIKELADTLDDEAAENTTIEGAITGD